MNGIIIFEPLLVCSTIKCEIYNMMIQIKDNVGHVKMVCIDYTLGTLCWWDNDVKWLKIRYNGKDIFLDNAMGKNEIPDEILMQARAFMSDTMNYKIVQLTDHGC